MSHAEPGVSEDIQQSFPNPGSPLPSGSIADESGQRSPSSPQGRFGGGSFTPSSGVCVAEQGLLGRVLCEESSSLDASLSPWAGEGGYGRAPGFEREDQVSKRISKLIVD